MLVIVSKPEPHIAVVTLNRPEAANALSMALAQELKIAINGLTDVRSIILTANGKTFCAGADLKERKGMTEAQWHTQHEAFEAARDAILHSKTPVIAAVNGPAFGGGLELALACDFIYAANTTRFALTEATLGIMPGLGGTQTLPRAIGQSRARELIFTGKAFSAQEAFEWGMINRLCSPEKLFEETLTTARTIANNAPLSVKAIKASMNEGAALPLEKAIHTELKHYHTLLETKDRHEGINAWGEKRKPVFKGN